MRRQKSHNPEDRSGLAIFPWLLLFAALGVGVFFFFLWLDNAVRRAPEPTAEEAPESGRLVQHYRQQLRRQSQVHSQPQAGQDPRGPHRPPFARAEAPVLLPPVGSPTETRPVRRKGR
jgi:hypothetical protein